MIHKVFTVWDSKVEAYLTPVCSRTKGEFLRGFAETCNNPKSTIGAYPADYHAFELGEFDDAQGTFNLHKAPLNLGCALEFVRPSATTEGDAPIRPAAA